jgi:hypothetical protein
LFDLCANIYKLIIIKQINTQLIFNVLIVSQLQRCVSLCFVYYLYNSEGYKDAVLCLLKQLSLYYILSYLGECGVMEGRIPLNPQRFAVWNVSDTGRSQYDTGRSQMKTKSQKNPSASAISSTPPSEKNRF